MGSHCIPIRPVETSACAGCRASLAGPVCRADLGEACLAPALCGPAAQVQQVLGALRDAWADGAGLQPLGLVRALSLSPGEAELTITAPPVGRGAQLADIAFHTLRRLLPDTDIYVRHAA